MKKHAGGIFLLVALAAIGILAAVEHGKPKGRLVLLLCLWIAAGTLEIVLSQRLKKGRGESTLAQGLLFLVFTVFFMLIARWYWF